MITAKARLSAKYIYIRCDTDFQLNFTNGDSMPFWKGFYCLLTEDLQKYNTNNEFDIVTSDNGNIWWMSTDTLIMSVNDINTEMLNVISDIANNNANANIQQLQNENQQTNLLMSIQNTLSTFLNTYVALHQVVDYGFQTAMIDGYDSCTLYIAKPTAGYTFNCSITYNRTIKPLITAVFAQHNTGTKTRTTFTTTCFADYVYFNQTTDDMKAQYSGQFSNVFAYFTSNDVSYDITNLKVQGITIHSLFPSNSAHIPFVLKSNDNTLLSGYSISNVSASVQFSMSGSVVRVSNQRKSTISYTEESQYYQNVSYSKSNFLSNTTYDSANGHFILSGSGPISDSVSVGSLVSSYTAPVCTESLSLNFDVTYTPS